jgi:hypothetical protein
MEHRSWTAACGAVLVALAVSGCPAQQEGENADPMVVTNDTRDNALSDTGKNPGGESPVELVIENSAETVKEGASNLVEGVTSKWPGLQKSVDKQIEAWNAKAQKSYSATFTDDSPSRDQLVAAFGEETADADAKFVLREFDVTEESEKEAKATVVIDKASSVDKGKAQRLTRTYTFRKDKAGEWKVYDVVQLNAQEVDSK